MSWGDNLGGKWFKLKEGDVKEFTIKTITEHPATGMIKPLPNKKTYFDLDTDLGILTVNNGGLYRALSSAREGDRVRVHYIKKGTLGVLSNFKVDILEKGDEVQF